ncbi:MAG: MFS transporter [Rhodospirillales bacterium]|nr:MFS transporter [Rhodospirillales bacterium]MDE2198018.1 MFS transporter [Rhodospirillales bacterium]MDE2574580.1 MFS transporter [Rhodospirillales bacterium]
MVNAGARLDRLPISAFHYSLLGLIGAGMFLDAFEIYLQGGVLATLVATHWSTPALNADFISSTFAGMVVGAWLAGITGDRFGRRFAYQVNLLVFGLAALAGAVAPSMSWLIAARFVMGLGLGAEIVVGYVTISEFVPPLSRGRWGTGLAIVTNSALFVSALVARVVIPNFGWRWMFVIAGIGALFVWILRRKMPESPRWLESKGRTEEAEAVMSAIERRVAPKGGLPAPVAGLAQPRGDSVFSLFAPGMVMRTIIGSVVLIALNTAVYGFIAFLPTFMVKQGMSVVTSLNYATLMMFGGPVGALIGFWLADRLGRKNSIVLFSLLAVAFGAIYPQTSSPAMVTLFGFLLITAVYVLVAVAWALYVPELFPTVIRMRGAGFCNTAGRLMTILTPQLIVPLFVSAGVNGVIGLIAALLLLQALLVGLFGVETREKPLEALTPWQEGDGQATAVSNAGAG